MPENFAEGGTIFIEQICLPFLLNAQNSDGGWGFTANSDSRVEATAWALLALRESSPVNEAERVARAIRFLHSAQLPDGSWPSAPGQEQGAWVTALACWSLASIDESKQRVSQALKWLGSDHPGDSRLWGRILRRLTADRSVVNQNPAYFGWSWTPGTASWVEPTSYALLVLRHSSPNILTEGLQHRLRIAESMLFDRMCPRGGWNCGNPMVYGVPGEAQIGPTVWALLALKDKSGREEVQKSLEWLEKNWNMTRSPGSLALALIGLTAYRRPTSTIHAALCESFASDNLFWSVPAVAWSLLAKSPARNWLKLAMPIENA
jgi:hypothetical protein